MNLKSINPYTGAEIEEFVEMTDEELEKIILQSGEAFEKWKKSDFDYRRSLMAKAASLLRSKVKEYDRIITSEMGKPLKESEIEVDKCAWACDYYAENAPEFLKKEPVETDADISYVSYEPLGPILGIMPWNFPFWQVFRFAVPTTHGRQYGSSQACFECPALRPRD